MPAWLDRLFGRSRGSVVHTRRTLEGIGDETARQFRRDGDGYQGRKVGSRDDPSDMTDQQRQAARRLALGLYHSSSVYGAVVDRFMDHVLGDGIKIEVDDDRAQEWLDEQLAKRENRFHETIGSRLTRLANEGEYLLNVQTLLRSARSADQLTPTADFFLGRLNLDGIETVSVSPFNHDAVTSVHYRVSGAIHPSIELPIACPGSKLVPFDLSGEPVEMDGQLPPVGNALCAVQFWRARTLGRRSGPLFSRIVDRAASMEELIENMLRKVEYLNRWWLHVKHKKANDETMGKGSKDLKFAKDMVQWLTGMKSGEVAVTDQDVSVEAVFPKLEIVDFKAFYDIVLELILGAYGIPRMWFSSGGETNRATSAEQGSPVHRFIKSWQQSVAKVALEELVLFLLDLGARAGVVTRVKGADPTSPKSLPEHQVVMADVATRDNLRDTQECTQLVLMLNEATNARILTPEERTAIGRGILGSKLYGSFMDENDPVELTSEDDEDDVDALDDPSGAGAQPKEDVDQDSTPAGEGLKGAMPAGGGQRQPAPA